MKKIVTFISIIFLSAGAFFASSFAKQVIVETHMESSIMLDVARRYFSVGQIKQIIDALAQHDNSTLQIHFTDDQNVGIECAYLGQTAANATLVDGIYYYRVDGEDKPFLSYGQVRDIMDYAAERDVTIIPEIDVPAHMNGFFKLAIQNPNFGEEFVRNPWNWGHQEESGIAWKEGEEGNLDILAPNAKPFLYSLLDEYTEFFADLPYFHIGFDEYTLRTDPTEKIPFANELYDYLVEKGFKPRMWSDTITKDNISVLNNGYEIVYWGWKQADVKETDYATVPDLQEAGFKTIISNKYYLFFVPSPVNTTDEVLEERISNIENDWELEEWNYNYGGGLENHDNILGAMVAVWGEDSEGVGTDKIVAHTIDMYNAMFPKLDVYTKTVEVEDDEEDVKVPNTGMVTIKELGSKYAVPVVVISGSMVLFALWYIKKRRSEHKIFYKK